MDLKWMWVKTRIGYLVLPQSKNIVGRAGDIVDVVPRNGINKVRLVTRTPLGPWSCSKDLRIEVPVTAGTGTFVKVGKEWFVKLDPDCIGCTQAWVRKKTGHVLVSLLPGLHKAGPEIASKP